MGLEPVELGWSVAKDVAEWLKAAHAAARNRAQRRIANVVEHAGVLVAGVHKINAEALKLIKPLVYFDPDEWDAARRTTMINELISFTDQTVVVPQMRMSMSSLQNLLADVTDRDVAEPAGSILGRVGELFLRPDSPRGPYGRPAPDSLEVWPDNDAASLLVNVQNAYFSDAVVEDVLLELLDLLRAKEYTEYRRDELRTLASSLTAEDSYMGRKPQSAVVPYKLQEIQEDFGRLIAAQQRSFPEMPRPNWAFF